MKWERPDVVEIGMNAEIGGYQSDFGEGEPVGPSAPVGRPSGGRIEGGLEKTGSAAREPS